MNYMCNDASKAAETRSDLHANGACDHVDESAADPGAVSESRLMARLLGVRMCACVSACTPVTGAACIVACFEFSLT